MADQDDVADIMEQENVVVVDDGPSGGLPATIVVTSDDGIMVAEAGGSVEPSMNQQQHQRVEEEVGGILEQAIIASHNLVTYDDEEEASSVVEDNNATGKSVVSVVEPSGEIVNTVVSSAVISNNGSVEKPQHDESVVTTDTTTTNDTTMEETASAVVISRNSSTDAVVSNVVSSVLSIPRVVHLQQAAQVQELPVASADQGSGRTPSTPQIISHVRNREPSTSSTQTQQPVVIDNHRYVDGAGNFTVVAPPVSSSHAHQQHHNQQHNSLSRAIMASTTTTPGNRSVSGSTDDNTEVIHLALSHQTLVNNQGLTTTGHPHHVLATTSGVTTATIADNSNGNTTPININNGDDDDDAVNNDHHNEMVVPAHVLSGEPDEDEEDELDQDLDPDDEIHAQNQDIVDGEEDGVVENGEMDTNGEEGLDSETETNNNQSSSSNGLPTGSISITLAPSNDESGAPLGSSQNPIRIIQQGNQYTPLQQLTTDQLQQIMQVVQQQQLARNTQAEGSSILYNPQTNTRIVYRVIYPSELHKSAASVATTEIGPDGSIISQSQVETHSQGQQTITFNQLQRRPYRRRNKDEEEKIDGPELTKEEKEERKKHRPRTRSGRVSKPPKHMVKDYKHIHVLDWDEDYDDSDGGYSDIKYSEEEEAERRAAGLARGSLPGGPDEPYIHPGLGSSKPKNFKCETCSKAYIGRAGLARHYRLNPDHGQLSAEDELELRNQVLHQSAATNGLNNSGNLSEDSNTQDSILGLSSVPKSTPPPVAPPTPTPVTTISNSVTTSSAPTISAPSSISISTSTPTSASTPNPTSNNINHVVRGRKLSHLHETPTKRKARLKELIKQCEDEELMEIVLPRLATVITVWEFLLMKVEKGRPSRPHMADVYKEFETLQKQVQKMCQKYLSLLPEGDNHLEGNSTNKLQIQNPVVAQALGLKPGTYEVKEVPVHEDNTFQYKLLTTEPSTLSGTPCQTAKRTVELVTQEQLVSQPLNKRIRLVSLNTNDLSDISQFPALVTLPGPATNHAQTQQQSHTRSTVDCTNNNQSQLPSQPQRTPLSETNNIQPVVEPPSNSDCVTGLSKKTNNKVVLTNANTAATTTPIRTIVHFTNSAAARNGTVVQLAGTMGANGTVSSVATTTASTTKTTTALPLVNGIPNAPSGTAFTLPIRVLSATPSPTPSQSTAELVPPLPPQPPHAQIQTPVTVLPHVTAPSLTLPNRPVGSDQAFVASVQPPERPEPSPSSPSGTTAGVGLVDATDSLHEQTPTPPPPLLPSPTAPPTSSVSLPISVSQSPPSSPTQTSVVAAVQIADEPPSSSPLTQLTQIPPSSSPPQIQIDEVADEASVAAAPPTSAVGVEHTVMEVPLSMETSQPITVAVSNASVLDLGHLNSEDGELKTRVLGSIDPSPIIFQEGVAPQIDTTEQLVSHSSIFQTADGIIIIQKPDGTTMQFQGEQSISLETVQALLAMDTDGQLEQVTAVQPQTTDMEEQ